MTSKLTELRPLTIVNGKESIKKLPMPELIYNFRFLHFFLDDIFADWNKAISPYQQKIDEIKDESGFNTATAKAFLELQPIFLKNIFSYSMFFVSAKKAYERVYEQLNKANYIARLNIKHEKPPSINRIIRNIQRVRNWSIVHIASKKTDKLSSLSAISWQPLTWGRKSDENWDLNQLSFGSFRRVVRSSDGEILEESKDIELPGFQRIHSESMKYLENFDDICFTYLSDLHTAYKGSNDAP